MDIISNFFLRDLALRNKPAESSTAIVVWWIFKPFKLNIRKYGSWISMF